MNDFWNFSKGAARTRRWARRLRPSWRGPRSTPSSTWQVNCHISIKKITRLPLLKTIFLKKNPGGWAGGAADSPDFVKNCDLMWKQSVWSSAISASLASAHLTEGGLLVLPGARPAEGGTPGMIGYGMAKAAVHQVGWELAGEMSHLILQRFRIEPNSCTNLKSDPAQR